MSNKNKTDKIDFEQFLNKALKSHGFLFPETDEQMDKFLENLEDVDLPDELNDPMNIFPTHKNKLTLNTILSDDSDYEETWAIAARSGNEITNEVKEQMRKDREEAERKQ